MLKNGIIFLLCMVINSCDFDSNKPGDRYSKNKVYSKENNYFLSDIYIDKNYIVYKNDTIKIVDSWIEKRKYNNGNHLVINNALRDFIFETDNFDVDTCFYIKTNRDGLGKSETIFYNKIIISELSPTILDSFKVYFYNKDSIEFAFDSISIHVQPQ